MLARFTQIDYDRHIALVAISESQTDEKMLGVARIILGRDLKQAEFSVVVGDPCQGKGIGATLLQRCLSIARERGIQKVTGTVLAENIQMLALGRKLGFNIKKEPGVSEYELGIDFGRN
jgi:acetyltransferase